MSSKKTYRTPSSLHRAGLLTGGSTTLRKLHIGACSSETPIMQKSCSNSDGCTTSRAPASTVKKVPSSILKNQLAQVGAFSHAGKCRRRFC